MPKKYILALDQGTTSSRAILFDRSAAIVAVASTTTEILDIAKYTLSVVPLFVLMGNFVTRAGMSRELRSNLYWVIWAVTAGMLGTVVTTGPVWSAFQRQVLGANDMQLGLIAAIGPQQPGQPQDGPARQPRHHRQPQAHERRFQRLPKPLQLMGHRGHPGFNPPFPPPAPAGSSSACAATTIARDIDEPHPR